MYATTTSTNSFLFLLYLFRMLHACADAEFEKPRYVRVNTNLMSRADALELFVKDGWIERPFAADTQTYDEFLEIVRTLDRWDFVSDMHVKNLFVFPPSSRRFWARNELVRESKLVLQDKVSRRAVVRTLASWMLRQ